MGLYHEMNLDLFRNSSQVHDSIVTFWPGQEVKKLLPATPTHRSGSATAAARAGDLAFFTTKFSLQTQNSIPPPANLKEKKCYIPTLLPTSRKCIRTSCVSPKRRRSRKCSHCRFCGQKAELGYACYFVQRIT